MKQAFAALALVAGIILVGATSRADEPATRSAWTAFSLPPGQTSSPGRVIFWNYCGACHSDGDGMPGTAALAAKYAGSKPALLEARSDLTPEFVTFIVRNGISVMPRYRKTELSDADLAVLAAYLAHR
jgi:mono/diheme cytochrome c family protein